MQAHIRVAGIAAAVAVATLASGCGGGGSGSKSSNNSSSSNSASTSRAQQKAEVRNTWIRFFAGSTPAGQKVQLLQNGQQFAPVIRAQSKSSIARSTKAKVSQVKLTGAKQASVTYTIDVGGTPALKNQHGTAVKVGGQWKVGDRSFCQLLALQGKPPPGCPSG